MSVYLLRAVSVVAGSMFLVLWQRAFGWWWFIAAAVVGAVILFGVGVWQELQRQRAQDAPDRNEY